MKLPFLLDGLAFLTAEVSSIRNGFYDRGWIETVRATKPVISLGNLTVGGTGKTPIADFCLRLLLAKGHRPALVCRSYRGSQRVPRRVLATDPPGQVGDEALWFALRHPEVPVWSGPSKSESALAVSMHEPNVDVILVDDGFQHRRLHRDLDICLLDATEAPGAYRTVPAGRARERFEGIGRADILLWTKTNWASGNPRPAVPTRPTFSFAFHLRAALADAKSLLVSAIAKPEGFLRSVRAELPRAEFREIRFRDHHPYTTADVDRVVREAREFGATAVLTTEKDEVKLRPLWSSADLPLHAAQLEAELEGAVESFYEVIARVLPQRV